MSSILEQFGGVDITERLVRGRISRIDGNTVYAVIPSFNMTHEFGPMTFASWQNYTPVSVGDAVLIGFDEQGSAWVASWNGIPVVSNTFRIDVGMWPYLIIEDNESPPGAGGAGMAFQVDGGSDDLYVDGGRSGINVYQDGVGDYLRFSPAIAGSHHGIMFGGAADVSLYRDAPGVLRTDGQLIVEDDAYFKIGAAQQVRVGDAGATGEAGIALGSAADIRMYRQSAGRLRVGGELLTNGDLYGGYSANANFAIVAGDGGTSTCRILTYVGGNAYERIVVNASGVTIMSIAGISPTLSVAGKASFQQSPTLGANIQIGGNATDGAVSGSLQSLGYGVDHFYINFTPSTTPATRRVSFGRAASDNPFDSVQFAAFGGDDSIYLGSGTDAKIRRSAAGEIMVDAALKTSVGGPFVPVGAIMPYGGSSAPTGYLLCDGTSYATATYPALFSVIGYAYGGSGANFNVPNTKGRMIAGRDAADAAFDVLGETGGAKTVTLTALQSGTRAHSHGVTDPTHSHGPGAGSFFGMSNASFGTSTGSGLGSVEVYAGTTGGAATNISIQNSTAVAAQDAHENLPPYIVLNHIIRAV